MYIYFLFISLYKKIVRLLSLFGHKKAKKRHLGSKQTIEWCKNNQIDGNVIWMHCASLGEYEQGKPVLNELKRLNPKAVTCLSLFSPSGYEPLIKTNAADQIVYLPWDLPKEIDQFISTINPSVAIFVKYEWWLGYFNKLDQLNIPTYVISATFRKSQPFFKPWGGIYRKALKSCTSIFVQNKTSIDLLKSINVNNYILSGDTRLDRTIEIADSNYNNEQIAKWKGSAQNCLIVGSAYLKEIDLLVPLLNKELKSWRIIIAPHEVDTTNIKAIVSKLYCTSSSLLSNLTKDSNKDKYNSQVLIIDSIGILSRIYRYANIALIGGGFGKGIHNTLEPIAYKLPIAFGPNYKKFPEAIFFVKDGIAKTIDSTEELKTFITHSINSTDMIQTKIKTYLETNKNTSKFVAKKIQTNKI